MLFVGNRRPYAPRPIVEKALAAEGDVDVWGHGWDGRLPDGVWRGKSIPNPDLGRYYASADVVLNDHTSDMLRDGLVSNRVFDVLASGRPILTERMRGVPSDIAPFLTFYGEDDFEDALAQAREAGGRDRREIADHVRTDHSFARRAAEILEVVNG